MKPCRDCGVPTAASARSCPSCGILNPVLQWVALPNGEHLTRREHVSGGGAMALSATAAAPLFSPPVAPKTRTDVFGDDRLASWAIWCALFVVLSVTLIGGAIGGLIAAVISVPVGKMLPTRPDGRKLPAWLSIAMIVGAVFVFFGSAVLVAMQP